MIWNPGYPQTSGSLNSQPIRENFDFLKVGLITHSSSSLNPHSTTLDQVCAQGASTTNAITVNASGSIVTSLLIPTDLQVGDDLFSKKIEHVVYAEHYASIQDALDALPATGGIVIVPRGTTEISSTITVSSKKALIGYGVECSTIKLADSSNCNMIEATSHYIHLEGFTLNGNKDNNTSGKGIYFDNVYVGSTIKDLIVSYCAEEGLHFSECSAFPIINVWSHHNGKDQFFIESGSESVHFYNCTAEWNTTYAGFHFKDTGPNALFGCHTEGCYYGVDIYNSDGIDVHNHYVDGACSGSIEAFAAVYIHGGSSNVIIQNVSILNSFSSGQIIFDEDNSYYIPETTLQCSYNNNNQYFRVLNLFNSGSSNATLLYSVGNTRFEFNKDLKTQAIDAGTDTIAGGPIRARENVQVNSDWTSGDEDAPIYFDGTVAAHRAEMRYDYGLDSFWFDKAIIIEASGSVLKSLRVQNNELIGDNLEVKGNILVDSSGSVLKSLNIVNDLQVGGNIIGNIVTTDTLDDVCERGAETDVAITVSASGSVLKSLRVQNNEQIGGSLEVEDNLEVKGDITADNYLYFKDIGLYAYPNGQIYNEDGILNLGFIGYPQLLQITPGIITAQEDVRVEGLITVASSGSVLKSLRVQNNETVGGTLSVRSNAIVNGYVQALTSGSVLKSLRVQNNELIGGNLEVKGSAKVGGNIYINSDNTDADAFLYFGKSTGSFENLKWDIIAEEFVFSDDVNTTGNLSVDYELGINCAQVNQNAVISFFKYLSGFETLIWNGTNSQFEFSKKINVDSSGSVLKSLRVQNNELIGGNLEVKGNILADSSGSVLKSLRVQNNETVGGTLSVRSNAIVNGYVQALTSGSVLKSLRVQNNELIGGNLEVKGNILADSSGSILKSLRVQNNLQVGGNIIGGKKTIILPIDAAILPDNSAGNMAATIERIKSSAGAPSPHFMQAWFNSTTDSFLYWDFRMSNDYGSGLTAKVQYKMRTATSGSIVLGVALMAVTPGDAQSVDTNDMGTVNSVTDTVPGTVNYLDEVSISLANIDSLVAGDFVVLYLMRDADNVSDTAKNDVEVVAMSLEYLTS